RWPHRPIPGSELLEFPMSTWRIRNRNIPVTGGAYFRIYPYPLSRRLLRATAKEGYPAAFYLHHWALDANHPRTTLLGRIGLPHGRYDAVMAMGFFDYVPDPVAMLKAMDQRAGGTLLMSFPKAREWRIPIRRLRFQLLRCPLYLYSEARVRRILRDAGVIHY